MRWLALFALLLSGCASMLQPIPGMAHLGDCEKGKAYAFKQELICDRASMPFVSRPLEPNDNAMSACKFCDGFQP